MTSTTSNACWALTLALLATPGRALAQEQAPREAAIAVGVDAGYGFYQSATGGWTDLFVAHELGLAERWALQLELGALLAWSSQSQNSVYHDASVPEDNTDDNFGYGALGRALLGFRASHPLVLRADVVLGVAHVSLDSTICGSGSIVGPTYGLSFAPVLRVGTPQHVELGLNLDMLSFPFLGCGNSGINPSTNDTPWPIIVEPEEFFDDPGIIVGGRFSYRWF